MSRDARTYCRFVYNMSKDNSVPRSMPHGRAVMHSDHVMSCANLFSEHFSSVYSTSSLADFNCSHDVPPLEDLPAVTIEDI